MFLCSCMRVNISSLLLLVVAMALNLELNSERYVQLLEKLIGESEFLQNNPPRFVPQEDK